jgi:glutathione S-transferase
MAAHESRPARVAPAMIRLYDYTASANCYKARLLLAQLGIAYEKVALDIFAGDTLTPKFERINPARSTPVLEVEPGRYLAESNAILAYLAEGSELYPADRFERAEILRWLLFEQTEVMGTMGGLRFRLITGRLRPDEPAAIRRRAGAEEAMRVIEAHLASREFFVAGRYTIADIAIYAYAHVAGEAGIDTRRYPAFEAWRRRVAAQPGHINDLALYPPNASDQAGRSIYG